MPNVSIGNNIKDYYTEWPSTMGSFNNIP